MRKRILAMLLLPFAAASAQIDEIGGIATSTLDLTGYSHIGGQALPSGGVGPSKTSLVAYHDYDNNSDSHSTFALSEPNGTPTYTSGYGIASDGSTVYWTQSDLDSSWGYLDSDHSCVFRFRGYDSVAHGDFLIKSHGNRISIRWLTSGIRAEIADIQHDSSVVPSVGTWYVVYMQWDSSEQEALVVVNSYNSGAFTGTTSFNPGDLSIGGDGVGADFEVSYSVFFNRILTQHEYEWFTDNPSIDRQYADLD